MLFNADGVARRLSFVALVPPLVLSLIVTAPASAGRPAVGKQVVRPATEHARRPLDRDLAIKSERGLSLDDQPAHLKARLSLDDTVARLKRLEDVPAPSGQTSAQQMAAISAQTGKEVALLRLEDGQRVLRLGAAHSASVQKGVRIIAHTHPGGELEFSAADEAQLVARGQSSSVIITPQAAKRLRARPSSAAGKIPPLGGRLNEPDLYRLAYPDANFAFWSRDENRWPQFLTKFFEWDLGVGDSRVEVKRYGAGKSGDLVFGVEVDGHPGGVLKVFRDPSAARTEARMLSIPEENQLKDFRPPRQLGFVKNVTIDGHPASAIFMERIPGNAIQEELARIPKSGPAREEKLAFLEAGVRGVARGERDLHQKMASGRSLSIKHKQDEGRFILAKLDDLIASNNATHIVSAEFLNRARAALQDRVIPDFVSSNLPATMYHGDSHPGNWILDSSGSVRPLDLAAMKWSVDNDGKGRQTGANDLGRFTAILAGEAADVLSPAEIARLQKAHLDEYFSDPTTSRADLEPGIRLYGAESQIASLQFGLGSPKTAMVILADMLNIKL